MRLSESTSCLLGEQFSSTRIRKGLEEKIGKNLRDEVKRALLSLCVSFETVT